MIYGLYHCAEEGAGLIADIMRRLELGFRELHVYSGDGLPRDTAELKGLVLMGGPMSVDDVEDYPFLTSELQLIERVLKEGKPVLGVCLGAQLIAKALGARVYANSKRELGWGPVSLTPEGQADPLFHQAPASFPAFHWHQDTFDLPKGAVHLARTGDCANQAFRYGDRTYAFQFHLEMTPDMIHTVSNSSSGAATLKAAGVDPERIRISTAETFKEAESVANVVLYNFLRLIQPKLAPSA